MCPDTDHKWRVVVVPREHCRDCRRQANILHSPIPGDRGGYCDRCWPRYRPCACLQEAQLCKSCQYWDTVGDIEPEIFVDPYCEICRQHEEHHDEEYCTMVADEIQYERRPQERRDRSFYERCLAGTDESSAECYRASLTYGERECLNCNQVDCRCAQLDLEG